MSKQVLLRLDEDLYETVHAEAKQRGLNVSQFIRERLRGQHGDTRPADSEAVKTIFLNLLQTDAEVIEALKAKP